MKISGFTFVRNGVMYDYPFIESINSLLPLCDEVIVAVGNSNDKTLDLIHSLRSPKIRIITTVWDESLRKGGVILAQQTNCALGLVSGEWAVYLQADEVLHEEEYDKIRASMAQYRGTDDVEGLLLKYKHFYGSYNYIGNSRKWYRYEVRIVKPNKGLHSWGDAQGFRINDRKLRVKAVDASVYHYGWVKSPYNQQLKQKYFNKLWHSDEWVNQNIGIKDEYDYDTYGKLKLFEETHPAVMEERVRKHNWIFIYDHAKIKKTIKEIILGYIEDIFGWRIGEYKNYKLL